MKRLLSLAALGVYAVGIAAGLFVSTPTAAATVPNRFTGGHWGFSDRSHISYFNADGAVAYQVADDKLDNDFTYGDFVTGKAQASGGDICKLSVQPNTHSIQGSSGSHPLGITTVGDPVGAQNLAKLNPLSISYSLWSAPSPSNPSGGCGSSQTYTASAPADALKNFNVLFNWQDPTTIVQAVDGKVFQQPSSDAFKNVKFEGKVYNEFIAGSGNCPDFVLVPTKPTDVSSGYWENAVSDSNNSQIEKGCGIGTDQVGVKESGHVLIAGFTAASTKPSCTDTNTCTPANDPNATPSCQIVGGWGWALCPFVTAINAFFTKILDVGVIDLLKTGALPAANRNNSIYQVWGAMRNFADIFFVLIFLVIIFSSTLSIGLDNYDIKKMLPRLVGAAILVQFSWVLMQLAFDITNILGSGVGAIVATIPGGSGGPSATFSNITAAFAGLGLLATGAIVVTVFELIVPLLMALLAAVISVLAVFVTLELRKIILVALVVLAPLAFIAWVLPNTESMFKTWWKLLSRLLIMYPMIIFLFALTNVAQGLTSGSLSGPLQQFVTAILPSLAFFMVPWTFKWAGGAMSAVGGAVTARAARTGKNLRNSESAKEARKAAAGKFRTFQSGGGLKLPGGRQMLGSGHGSGRVAARLARLSTLTSKTSALRGDYGNTKREGDLMALEGYTTDDQNMMIGQDTYFEHEKADLSSKLALGVANGGIDQSTHDTRLAQLNASRAKTHAQWGNRARVAASVQAIGSAGLANQDTLAGIQARFKGREALGEQLWNQAAVGSRTSNPLLMYRHVDGSFDKAGAVSYLKRQNQSTWAGYSADLYKDAKKAGIIRDLAADPQARGVLESVLTRSSGPSTGGDQQAILNSEGIK